MITKPSALKARFIPKPRSMSRAFSARSQSIKDPGALPQAGIEAAPSAPNTYRSPDHRGLPEKARFSEISTVKRLRKRWENKTNNGGH